MILLLVLAIISTVFTQFSCDGDADDYFDQGEIIEMIVIDTNYSQVFNACDISQNIMCKIKYDVHNTNETNIKIYYELFTINGLSYEKYEVCNGLCEPSYVNICCNDIKHKPKFVRVTVVNMKEESPIILRSLGVEYQHPYTSYVILYVFLGAMAIMLLVYLIIMIGICYVNCTYKRKGMKTVQINEKRPIFPCFCCWLLSVCNYTNEYYYIFPFLCCFLLFKKKSRVQNSNDDIQDTNTDTLSMELEETVIIEG